MFRRRGLHRVADGHTAYRSLDIGEVATGAREEMYDTRNLRIMKPARAGTVRCWVRAADHGRAGR